MARWGELETTEKGGVVRREGGGEVGEIHSLVGEGLLYFPYNCYGINKIQYL